MNKKNYLILAVFFIVLMEFILPVPSFPGTVETRISSSTLQSFIENTFPVTFTTNAKILGDTKIPINVKLTNPRLVLLSQTAGTKKPFLKLNMDYEVSSIAEIKNSVQGHISGDLDLAVSQDQESLIVSPRESFLSLLPSLKVSFQTMLKPIRFPLFKGLPVKMNGYEVYAKFSNILINVENDHLVIKSEVTFEKKLTNEGAVQLKTGRHVTH
ncbi:MAG: hypothetical protein AUK24_09960 [Syntrophaceae bacterium CG2_30_49_12]|nr:MAG: hypothetical protein AUK24_09960 [Syntrophaceae bacterium CG2_30_49_12]PIP05644.1 MAG: hypothetical protein COX52_10870 [Syntrophobacterales bacterium CG23_combo_of_CG06-09_8_20_14_all_48_27]PJA49070.1 MAG: hypothetical protein CO171_05960 [Syntrophobacterales bacterium CG_4_9_14_3_um_filter_49_8]PJC73076.1 MAG: hypothetical protein CO012_10320 [Syntrophobacterales bacterium CG_4_8_14_3_um_filter_49_14]